MAMQGSGSSPSRNQASAAAKPGKVSVGQPGNGSVSGHKGGPDHQSSPGKAVTGFTTNVKSGFVK